MKLLHILLCMFSLVNQLTAHQVQLNNVASHLENNMVFSHTEALPDTHGGERLEDVEELKGNVYTITSILF